MKSEKKEEYTRILKEYERKKLLEVKLNAGNNTKTEPAPNNGRANR